MASPRRSPVALSLFDYIDEAAAALGSQSRPFVGIPGEINVFCDNFFLQFFANGLGENIAGISDQSREHAAQLRLRLVSEKKPMEVIQLVGWFERLCRIHPDILGEQYDDDDVSEAADAFIEEYVVGLLERIVRWAEAVRLAALANRARAALRIYKEALRQP